MEEHPGDRPITYLKEGINLKDLLSGRGTTFEIDTDLEHDFEEDLSCDYFAKEPTLEDVYESMTENGARNKHDWLSTSFQSLSEDMEPLCSDGGVLKKVLKQGYGNIIPANSRVTCHYNAFFEMETSPFDSSRLRDIPFHFVLGKGEALLGFDIAVKSMKRGEVSEFIISSNYAYGPMGCPPRVRPNATVFYEIEIISFIEMGEILEDSDNLTAEERKKLYFRNIMSTAKAEHMQGGERFAEKNYQGAKQAYRRALNLMESLNLANDEEEKENLKLRIKLHLNLAQCNLFLNTPGIAAFHCKRVLELDDKNVKANYRHGKALRIMGEFEEADRYLTRAMKLEPTDPHIIQELRLNEKEFNSYLEREKRFCQNMFGSTQDPPEEIANNISESLKNSLRSNIEKFVEDKDMQEYPYGSGFNESELKFIVETAQEFGLKCISLKDCDTKLKLVKQ